MEARGGERLKVEVEGKKSLLTYFCTSDTGGSDANS
jgi:hypothetical protein